MKLKALLEVEVPEPVGEQLFRDQRDVFETRFHMPVRFTSGDAGEHEYTYNLEAPIRWERVDG